MTCVYLWEEGYVIYSCTSDDKVVRVPKEIKGKPVIAIGERGLANLKHCEAIVLPDTVRYIGKGAFTIDNKLKYVHFGKSIETVEDDVFNSDSSLESVVFPEGTKSIGTLGYFVIASEQEIRELRYQESNKLVKILFEKLGELNFSEDEVVNLFFRKYA